MCPCARPAFEPRGLRHLEALAIERPEHGAPFNASLFCACDLPCFHLFSDDHVQQDARLRSAEPPTATRPRPHLHVTNASTNLQHRACPDVMLTESFSTFLAEQSLSQDCRLHALRMLTTNGICNRCARAQYSCPHCCFCCYFCITASVLLLLLRHSSFAAFASLLLTSTSFLTLHHPRTTLPTFSATAFRPADVVNIPQRAQSTFDCDQSAVSLSQSQHCSITNECRSFLRKQ